MMKTANIKLDDSIKIKRYALENKTTKFTPQ